MKPRRVPTNILLLLIALSISGATICTQTPYERVDPQIGTDNEGNTFPGASLPFGMIQWSPDTQEVCTATVTTSCMVCP